MASEEKMNSVTADSADNDTKKRKSKKNNKEIDGVVVIKKKGPSAKPVIMGLLLVVLAAAAAAALTYFIKNKPEIPSETIDETTVNMLNGGNLLMSPAQATASMTTAPMTAAPEVTTKQRIVPEGDAKTFVSGTYSLDGTIYVSGGSGGDAVTIARSPDSSEISGLCSGMWLAVLDKDGQRYLIDNESKTYIDFTDEAYDKLGVDKIPYDVSLPGDISSCEFKRADVLLSGDDAVCWGADYDGGHVDIYTVDGALKQFVVFDKDYNPLYEVIVNSFSSAVAVNQLTTDALAKSTSVFSFFSALG